MKLADRQGAPAAPPQSSDAIGAWLDRLLRLTRLPPRPAAELRDELEGHLRERVRDLMLAGDDEPAAIHKAISELGDLALLAHRYRDAHRTPKGRLVMHTMLVTAVAAALGLSSLALRQSGRDAPPAPATAGQPDAPPLLGDIPLLRYSMGAGGSVRGSNASQSGEGPYVVAQNVEDQPLGAVLQALGGSSESRVFVYWSDLNQWGIDREGELPDMPLAGQTVERALAMLSNVLNLDGAQRLDYRVENGLMEIATRGFFQQRELDLDQRQLQLVSYDAAGLLAAESPLDRSDASETLIQLVTTLIEPDIWETNGGFASVSAAGNRLFVSAPPRIHSRVAWLLEELMKNGETHSARERALEEFLASTLALADPEPRGLALDRLRGDIADELLLPATVPLVRAEVGAAPDARRFVVRHADPAELGAIIGGALAPVGGAAHVGPEPGTLVVTGGSRAHQIAEALIGSLDRAPQADEAAPAPACEPMINVSPVTRDSDLVRVAASDGRCVVEIEAACGARQRIVASGDGRLLLDSVASNGSRQLVEASELQFSAGEVIWHAAKDARGMRLEPPHPAPGATSLAEPLEPR